MSKSPSELWNEAVVAGEPYGVYVPVKGAVVGDPRHPVALGSAIVGRDTHDDWIDCCYEGNLYDSFRTFDEMVEAAGARLVTHYPTVARGRFRRDELEWIGSWSPGRGFRLVGADAYERWRAKA